MGDKVFGSVDASNSSLAGTLEHSHRLEGETDRDRGRPVGLQTHDVYPQGVQVATPSTSRGNGTRSSETLSMTPTPSPYGIPPRADERPDRGPSGTPFASERSRSSGNDSFGMRSTAQLKWDRFDPNKETWEDYRYRYVDGPLAENYDPDKLMTALFKALPAESIAYMREREMWPRTFPRCCGTWRPYTVLPCKITPPEDML